MLGLCWAMLGHAGLLLGHCWPMLGPLQIAPVACFTPSTSESLRPGPITPPSRSDRLRGSIRRAANVPEPLAAGLTAANASPYHCLFPVHHFRGCGSFRLLELCLLSACFWPSACARPQTLLTLSPDCACASVSLAVLLLTLPSSRLLSLCPTPLPPSRPHPTCPLRQKAPVKCAQKDRWAQSACLCGVNPSRLCDTPLQAPGPAKI